MSQTKAQLIDNLVQPITGALGSASAPTFSFTSDPNTGLYSPGADQLALTTGGTGRLFIDSNGNIGLGTSSLINSAGYTTLFLNGSTGGSIGFKTGDVIKQYIYSTGTTLNYYGGGADSHIFYCSTEKMRLTATGLGIGTSSPSNALTVQSTSRPQLHVSYNGNGGIYLTSANDVARTNWQIASSETTANTLQIYPSDSVGGTTFTTPAVTIDASRRVGIGSNAPAEMLTVGTNSVGGNLRINSSSAGNNGLLRMYASDGVEKLQVYATTTATTFYTPASIPLTFDVAGSERFRCDSSGRLLVGTSSARTDFYNGTFTPTIQLEGLGSAGSYFSLVSNANNTGNEAGIVFGKSRGSSLNSKTIVQNGDSLGYLVFQGADGSDLVEAATIGVFVDGTPGANDMPGRLVFSTTSDGASSPTTRMQILANGATKMSTSGAYWTASPVHEMWTTTNGGVICQMTSQSNSDPYGLAIVFPYASVDNNSNYFLTCNDSTTVRTRIYSDGDVWTSDAGTLTSDVTLKRDITDASPKLADVMKLRVRNFYWQEDYHPNKQDKKLIGFIAQEFEEVFPGLVSEHVIKGGDPVRDKDGNETGEKTPEVFKKGIKEAKLVPILVKALQEAVERIEALEAEVATLKAQ